MADETIAQLQERVAKLEAVLNSTLDTIISLQGHISASMDREAKRDELLLKGLGKGHCENCEYCIRRCEEATAAKAREDKKDEAGLRLYRMIELSGHSDECEDTYKVMKRVNFDKLPEDRSKWAAVLEEAIRLAEDDGILSKRAR